MNRRILVVTDEENSVNRIRTHLERHDYTVETASDGEDALVKIRRDCPDLLITDEQLPDITGPELIAVLRRNPVLKDLPVLLLRPFRQGESTLSSYHRGEEYAEGIRISKPFSPAELISRVGLVFSRIDTAPEPA